VVWLVSHTRPLWQSAFVSQSPSPAAQAQSGEQTPALQEVPLEPVVLPPPVVPPPLEPPVPPLPPAPPVPPVPEQLLPQDPPQSICVSSPSFFLSLQCAGAQTLMFVGYPKYVPLPEQARPVTQSASVSQSPSPCEHVQEGEQ
jgi:hypothetical protein